MYNVITLKNKWLGLFEVTLLNLLFLNKDQHVVHDQCTNLLHYFVQSQT